MLGVSTPPLRVVFSDGARGRLHRAAANVQGMLRSTRNAPGKAISLQDR